jgi:HSP20 family protein
MSAVMQTNGHVQENDYAENAESQNAEASGEAGKRQFSGGAYIPRANVFETEDALLLFADMPGVKPEDVSLNFQGDQLVLHGRCGSRQNGKRPLHREYGVGNYYRTFLIAEQIEPGKIEAELKDGVLAVRVPKAEAVRPRRISVKGG